jgi:serine/threonine-protein kinase ATR
MRSNESSALNENDGDGREMSHWLREQLESSGVLSIIEPYWKSLYKQNEASKSKMPPFFSGAKTYYIWLSDWGRFMIERSANNQKSIYRELFFATRSALRSEVGLVVIEFLFPYLILDAICFGDELDKRTVLNELSCALTTFSNNYMPILELQKSISLVFSTIKVFQWWSENEIEAQRVDRSSPSVRTDDISDKHQWPTDISLVQISELLDNISLDACSQAAEFVGMFAQSVYFLEVGSRKKEAQTIDDFATHTKPVLHDNYRINAQNKHCVSAMHTFRMNLGRAHRLFSELDDQYSMAGIANCRSDTTILDQILEKKACKDWDSVLRLCELSPQLENRSSKSNIQNIRQLKAFSMLKLGQIESALNFALSVTDNEEANPTYTEEHATLVPCAIEASWRLGRWDLLQKIIFSNAAKSLKHGLSSFDFESRYNFHLGCAMLSLREHDTQSLFASIREGREAIIPSLSVVANENYPRALPYLTKLQVLQEIESACQLLSDNKDVTRYSEDYLKQFLGSVHPQITTSMDSIAVRLAISSIISDKSLQTSLWLTAGKLARKDGLYQIAESYLSHAYSIYQETRSNLNYDRNLLHCGLHGPEIKLQMAKVKHANGETTAAIRMLTSQAFEELILISDENDLSRAVEKLSAEHRLLETGRTGLQSTQWLVESGLKSGSEAIRRYKVLTIMLPDWERGKNFIFSNM